MDTTTSTFPVPRSGASFDEMQRWQPQPGDSDRRPHRHDRSDRTIRTQARSQESAVRRGVASIGLVAVALIHVLDLPGKVEETPYLAVAYLGLIGVALLTAEALVRRDTVLGWLATLAIMVSTVAGFVLTRTVGLPGAMDDIGNWLEPLGLASLFVEGVVALTAVVGLSRRS
jgi:hypothetical protein